MLVAFKNIDATDSLSLKKRLSQRPLLWTVEIQYLRSAPEIKQDHPLNLSISVSGGKETNKDCLSSGE